MVTYRRTLPSLTLACGLAFAVFLPVSAAHAAAGVAGDSDFLGSAQSLAVLGGLAVSNTGPSVITGDVGLSPGLAAAVTGFPPGLVNGTIYTPPAAQAVNGQSDASNAYDALEALGGTAIPNELGGLEYGPGVYHGAPAANTLQLTGTVVLNGGPDDVFVFQSSSTLITSSNSVVALVGGARACNVFWQVGSSATLGTSSLFAGTLIARTSVSATTDATVGSGTAEGARLLALDGSVTLDSNVIRTPSTCATATGGLTPGAAGTPISGPTMTTVSDAAAISFAAAAAARAANTPVVVAAGPSLAETGLDVRRPAAVAVLGVLVGVILVTGSARRRIGLASR
ncbi:MAG: DUF3494 domain-containing protein [Salinibacterium sp.]|nr:DUF3494 domain-containing protein [Salinibacterium sp.]